MTEHIDQMNSIIRLETTPSRIVSLVPSQTELLYDLGVGERLVGLTKFCIHPNDWFRYKSKVGGTKTIDIEKVRALKPDLIIGNKEENTKSDIEKLSQIAPVWMSDIQDLKGAYEMINQIACLVGETEKGVELVSEIRANFKGLAIDDEIEKSVLYFIWNSPNLIAAKKTFIDEMLQQMGLSNLSTLERYPEVDYEAQPDLVFLSSEPFPFKEKHVKKFESLYPAAKIIIVDGEMFSWYGSRLKHAPNYFQKLLKQIAID